MPVHQLFGKGGRVYALAAELDEWIEDSEPKQLSSISADQMDETAEPSLAVPARSPTGYRWRNLAMFVFIATALLLALLARQFWTRTLQAHSMSVPGRLLARLTAEGGHLNLIKVGSSPCNAVLTPDGARLLVANCGGRTVSVIDTAMGRVTREIEVGAQPESLGLESGGKRLIVGNFWSGIGIYDLDTGKSLDRIQVEGPITDISVTPDGMIYVARRERGLAVIHPGDHAIHPIPVQAMAMYLAQNQDGSRLYVSYQGGGPGGRVAHDSIDVYDTRLRSFISGIAGPPRVGGRMTVSPNGILLADGANACYAAEYRSYWGECPAAPGSVFSLIRTTDSRVIATLGFPGDAAGYLGTFPDGFRAITATQSVRVFDTLSLNALEAYALPSVRRVLFAPDGRQAWAVLQEKGAVAVLNTDRAACANPPRGLAGWWPGDGTPNDARGSDNNGVLLGDAGYAPGLTGQAFSFHGNGSLSLGQLANLATSTADFTAMAWVKFDAASVAEQPVFDRLKHVAHGVSGFQLRRDANGRLTLAVDRNSEVTVRANTTAAIPSGNWVHVAAVRASNSISVFVNGALAGTEKLSGPGWNQPESGDVRIGAGDTGGGLHGLVDEAQWYNRALDPAEISSVVAARSSGVCER